MQLTQRSVPPHDANDTGYPLSFIRRLSKVAGKASSDAFPTPSSPDLNHQEVRHGRDRETEIENGDVNLPGGPTWPYGCYDFCLPTLTISYIEQIPVLLRSDAYTPMRLYDPRLVTIWKIDDSPLRLFSPGSRALRCLSSGFSGHRPRIRRRRRLDNRDGAGRREDALQVFAGAAMILPVLT